MKTKKLPNTLELNPLKHEIVVDSFFDQDNFPEKDIVRVTIILSEDSISEGLLPKDECIAIGKHFLKISEAVNE